MKRFYITTPIYYVNDVPHLGHAYTTVAADVLARYHRARGEEVFFLTGTDEHGQKADQAAKKAGEPVQQYVDRHAKVFKELWPKLNITNDDFIRTTEPRHKTKVQHALQTLKDKGLIYAADYEGWYCVPDERFWTEKDLKDGNCPDCGRKVDQIREKNYFFKMGKFRDRLIEEIKSDKLEISPDSRKNEVLGFLGKELGDLCISRPKSRLPWGIELPFDHDYVAYVWFDALMNYATAIGYPDEKRFPEIWPPDVQFVGKDILTTHAVYWITMLMGLELPLPKKIFAHGWWTVEGRKMSKSLGNVVAPDVAVEAVGADQFRYFLMREVPFGLDGDFSAAALISRVNVDLANNVGNLVSRVLSMIEKYRDGKVPPKCDAVHILYKNEFQTPAQSNEELNPLDRYKSNVETLAFSRALEEMVALCDVTNRFIVESAPWTLAKNPSDKEALDDVLYASAEAVRIIGVMFAPFMPEAAAKLARKLGRADLGDLVWGGLQPGTAVSAGEPLFPRIDENKTKEILAMLTPKTGETPVVEVAPAAPVVPLAPEITIDDFMKIDLRTATVLSAEPVPKSKKLLKLTVDLGFEQRQVVAGIAQHYAPETIIGKNVVMVANLKPATLMGVESHGMLLAANDGGRLVLCGTWEMVQGGIKVK